MDKGARPANKSAAFRHYADYFTWALQRVYERGEDRFVNYLWNSVHLVHDIDDKRMAGYGVYYTQKKPLDAAALAWRKQNKTPGI